MYLHEDGSTMYFIALLNFQGKGKGKGSRGLWPWVSFTFIYCSGPALTKRWCSKLHALLATWGEVYYWFNIWKVKKEAKSLGIVAVRLHLQFFPVHCLRHTNNKALKSKNHPVPCARKVGGRGAQKNSRKDLSTSLWVHTIALDYLKELVRVPLHIVQPNIHFRYVVTDDLHCFAYRFWRHMWQLVVL